MSRWERFKNWCSDYLLGVSILVLFLLAIIIPLVFFAPFRGRDEKIYYTVGDEYCIIERIDHCLFFDDVQRNLYPVIVVGDQYFYEVDASFGGADYRKIEIEKGADK